MEMQTDKRSSQSPEYLIKRIDAIIAELHSLRQTVAAMRAETTEPPGELVEELAGSLGQGSWEEYDALLDWKRFDE